MTGYESILERRTTDFDKRIIEISDKGKPYASISNVITVILNPRYAEESGILCGRFFYDSFAQEAKLYGYLRGENLPEDTVRNIDDSIINKLGVEIERQFDIKFNKNNLIEAIRYVAGIYEVNPAKEKIQNIKWDGDEKAIRNLLPTYLGAEESDLNEWIMEHTIVGMIERIFEPGTKHDEMMVLLGAQGIGKSTFARLLALDDQWFCTIENISGKDTVMNLMGKSVVEIEEFVALRNAKSPNHAKSFLSKLYDRVRPPYDKFSKDIPRTCVMIGTLNETTFLNDHTGERRYHPVKCNMDKRKKPVYPKEEYLNNMTIEEYKKSVKRDFENAVAYGYKLYKSGKHSPIIPENLLPDLLRIQSECKHLNPDIEEIRNFIEIYKPESAQPDICCWKEYTMTGRNIKSKAFTEIMENYFTEWEAVHCENPKRINLGGDSIVVRMYYKKKTEVNEEDEFKASEQMRLTDGFICIDDKDTVPF